MVILFNEAILNLTSKFAFMYNLFFYSNQFQKENETATLVDFNHFLIKVFSILVA